MNKIIRQELARKIRLEDERGINRYGEIVIGILNKRIQKDAHNLYILNGYKNPFYEYVDFYQDLCILVTTAARSPRFFDVFEFSDDYLNFVRLIHGTYSNIRKKMFNKWKKISDKTNNLIINFFDESTEMYLLDFYKKQFFNQEIPLEQMSFVIKSAIESLRNPLRKSVFLLLYENNFSNKKIASILNLNENTVASHIRRGINEIKRFIKENPLE